MERDPHQLIEGVLIACYAVGLRAGVPLRPRRDGAAPRSASPRRSTTPTRPGYVGKNILGTDFSVDIVLHWGAGAYIVGEETGAHREPRGQPRHAPPQAAVLPGGEGPVPAADDRQQRRDAGQPAVDHAPTAATAFTAIGADDVAGHAHVRGVGPRQAAPACTRSINGTTTFRDLIYGDELLRRHPRRERAQGVHPRRRLGAVVLRPSSSTCRSRPAPSARPARCSARARSS